MFTPADEPDDGEVHSITNLALLDRRDNAALSNSVFEVKRREIIRRDKEGSYIPACTRNVFLKYYTDDRATSSSTSGAPRIARPTSRAIQTAVGPYLQPRGGRTA